MGLNAYESWGWELHEMRVHWFDLRHWGWGLQVEPPSQTSYILFTGVKHPKQAQATHTIHEQHLPNKTIIRAWEWFQKGLNLRFLTSRLVTKSSHVFCKRWEWVTCALHYRLAAMELQSKYVYLHTHTYIYIYNMCVCVWVSCSRGIKCNYTLIIISIMKDILTCNYITILYSHIEPRWNSPQGVRATIL